MHEPTIWVDKSGNNRASLELTGRTVQFGADRSGNGGDAETMKTVKPVEMIDEIADDEIPF